MGEIHKVQVRNSNKKYISIKDKVGFAISKSSSDAKLAKYDKVVGCVSLSMSALKIAATGDVQVSDVWDMTTPLLLAWIPGWGWAISGGYLLLDTGVEICTGKSIGEHLNDYTSEKYGFNTLNLYNITLK